MPTAQILPFNSLRTRPGLRDLLLEARDRLDTATAKAHWHHDASISPDRIQALIPDPSSLFVRTDRDIAEIAEQVSLLCLHAIHAGYWVTPIGIKFFMTIQKRAIRLRNAVGQG